MRSISLCLLLLLLPALKGIFDGQDIDLAMVMAGYAWWYRNTPVNRTRGIGFSTRRRVEKAKEERRGLWADPHPVPPWVWRKR
jgi:micrococcal nuclease